MQYHEFLDWEYAAVAAQALASYPGPDTVDCLKEGLKAANWYVRPNCADALIVGLKIQKKIYSTCTMAVTVMPGRFCITSQKKLRLKARKWS